MRELKRELWPHKVSLAKVDDVTEIEIWLGKQLGTFKGRWNVVYLYNATDFYFKNDRDRTLFVLRWS